MVQRRVLWTVDVGWEQATEAEAAAVIGWLRSARNPQRHRQREGGYPPGAVNPKTGKRILAAGYAPVTIAHNLSAVHGFYASHLHFGRGPVLNPVPENRARGPLGGIPAAELHSRHRGGARVGAGPARGTPRPYLTRPGQTRSRGEPLTLSTFRS
ncbi:hypothetical protein OG369_23305 [Streptomyces sp. NBC_01221]|uniref:hypothetical protein n=1 Tax=unclassified Streptomyces TaxID=2593676 RepID=UPI00352F4D41|nr:hypothetical protein [Streptomyces sp. NBC_01221]WSP57192.1 hypothetical protein OG306_24540 [Streptomyces sp. NBC_01241]WSU22090.1 hypothetical protein OG508_14690 [Streptomyces sp. NBC_01108]